MKHTPKPVFILIGIYIFIFIFTSIHALIANKALAVEASGNDILDAEVMAAHLEYVAQVAAQTEITLGALIGALSAALTVFSSGERTKQEIKKDDSGG